MMHCSHHPNRQNAQPGHDPVPWTLVGGQTDDDEPSAGSDQCAQSGQALLKWKVVEHGDAGDGLEGAQAPWKIRLRDVAGKDPRVRQAFQAVLCSGECLLISVDPDDFTARACQARAQEPLAASDVERPSTAPPRVPDDRWVEGGVVVPVVGSHCGSLWISRPPRAGITHQLRNAPACRRDAHRILRTP